MRDRSDRVSSTVATANGLATFAMARDLAANTNGIQWEREPPINDVASDNCGKSAGALAIYEESLTLRRRLAKIDPRNSQWHRDGAYFLERIGDEHRNVGMNQPAIAAYEESLAVWRHLAKIDRRNPQRQLNISVCLNKLGDVKLDAADSMGALAAYEESLTIRRHLSKGDPNNASSQLSVAESLEKIGDLKFEAGDNKGALAAYREMLSIDRGLVEIDGSNSEWQLNLSLSLERFGDVKFTVGDTMAAVEAYEKSLAVRCRLAASDNTNLRWQKEVSSSLEKINQLKRWVMPALESQLAEADYSESLENTSSSVGAVRRKLSAPSIPTLIAATRRQSRRYLRMGSVIVGTSSAQVRAAVRGLQHSAELRGLTLKWLFQTPSSPHGHLSRYGEWGPIPKRSEPNGLESRCAPFQHEDSAQGLSAVLVPIGKENIANNSLTPSGSSTGSIDGPHDATSVEAPAVTCGRASKMDVKPQRDQSLVNIRPSKRRCRKRKRHGASPGLPRTKKAPDDLTAV